MPLAGFVMGYLITMLPFLNLSGRVRRTVSTEVALQNVQVAAAVIQGSFTDPNQRQILGVMVVIPLLYYIFQVVYSLFIVVGYKIAIKKVVINYFLH